MKEPAIVLLGGSGLLGRALVQTFSARGIPVFAPSREALDVTDVFGLQLAMQRIRPKVVVNAAAFTDVDGAEVEQDLCRRINADGAGHVAKASQDVGAALVHMSTNFVFDGGSARPYTEADPINPISWYGATKAEGEQRVLDVHRRAIILRTAWLHGVGRPCFVRGVAHKLARGETVRAITDRRACPTSVDDLSEAIGRLIVSLLGGPETASGIYHLTGGGDASPYDLACSLADALGLSKSYVQPTLSAGWSEAARRPVSAALDSSLIADRFGITLPHWQHGVRRTLGRLQLRSLAA